MRSKIVPIDKIRPDKNQPRKIFDEKHISGLAESLKIEGLINPIEVDKDLVIITGECRWRAAKMAGWKKIPVHINETPMSSYERLRRQMAENVHQSSGGGESPMNPYDVAKGYQKMIEMRTGKPYLPGVLSYKEIHGIIKEIRQEVGIPDSTIRDYLSILTEPKAVIDDVIRGRSRTYYLAVRNAPKKYQETLRKAIVEGVITSRDDITRFGQIAKTRPEMARIELLRITHKQNIEANRVLNRAVELEMTFKLVHPEGFTKMDKDMIKGQLRSVVEAINKFTKLLK